MKKNKGISPPDLPQDPDKGAAASSYARVENKWLSSEVVSQCFFVIISLTLLTAFSVKLRVDQYIAWQKEPQVFFVNDIPMMTTHDAYHWLKLAKDYKDGAYITPKTALPDFIQVPMLSFMIAKLSPFFNNNVHKTGVYLMFILPGLFMIPLFLYFYKLGAPSAGVLGGLIGTASIGYLSRTLVAWVDTDALNLFFPVLAAFFMLLAANRERKYSFIFSALTGITTLVFHWWYSMPGFSTVNLVVLIVFLFVNRVEKKTILYSAIIYTIFANPLNVWQGIDSITHYLPFFRAGLAEAAGVTFRQTMSTVSEFGRLSFEGVLSMLVRPVLVSLTGLVLFFIFAFLKWRKFIPLLPVISLGLMAFLSMNRLVMYLTPLVGIGYGYLITTVLKRFFVKTGSPAFVRDAVVYGLSFVLFFIITVKTPLSVVPVSAASPGVYKALIDFKDRLPKGSIIFTWWDYGYAIQEATGFTTLHDGGNQVTLTTNFVARSFVSDSQSELYNIMRITAAGDPGALAGASNTYRELIAAIRSYEGPHDSDKLYLLFTEDMAGLTAVPAKFAAINLLGSWDPDLQAEKYEAFGDTFFNCRPSEKGNAMTCGDVVIDMDRGLINNNIPVKKTIVVGDGYILSERYYSHKDGLYLELFGKKKDNRLDIFAVKILPEKLYRTNLNQIYLLGNFDRSLFEEAYNEFPFARLLRVKTKE